MLWFWGLAGAFIYAGPKWVISLAGEASTSPRLFLISMLELVMALMVGTLAAGAFGPIASSVILTTLQLQDENAVAATIGLFANRLAPALVEKGASALAGSTDLLNRVLKALKGVEK